MKNAFFLPVENLAEGDELPLADVLSHLILNEQGLVPVIVQDAESLQVLMLAWMNAEAITRTLTTGQMTYWSRSRQSFWVKGETSGNTQQLHSMQIDCDGDSVLCKVNQSGPACHTNRTACFYLEVKDNRAVRVTSSRPKIDMDNA